MKSAQIALICLSLLVTGCDPWGPYSFSAVEKKTRLEDDLMYPFGISLPKDADISDGFTLGGRHRLDFFRFKITPAIAQKLIAEVSIVSTHDANVVIDWPSSLENTPFTIGSKDDCPPSLKKNAWWTPWDLQGPAIIEIKQGSSGRHGLWFCFSAVEGVAYVACW